MTTSRSLRRLAAAAVIAVGLLLGGCGFDAQTLQPYSQSHGVNVDASQLKVRNLFVIADTTGKGVLSGTLVSAADDTLTSVAGVAHKADGSDAGALTVTAMPLRLPAASAVVLTSPSPAVKVSSPDLKPGLTATVTLTLQSGTQVKANVPVMGSDNPSFAGIPLA